MAFDQDIRRFIITTGTTPVTNVRGTVTPSGRCTYEEYDAAANDYTSPISGKLTDLTAKYSAQSSYALTYIDPDEPVYTSLTPTTGTAAGGTTVVITGTGLNSSSCSVVIGGNTATALTTRNNATTISFVTPAHAAGAVSVVVTTAEGTFTAAGAFTYT